MVPGVIGWVEKAAACLAGGHEDRCVYHHEHTQLHLHQTIGVRPLPDCPAPPVGASFWITVFAAAAYADTPGYCVGDDELSRSVLAQGTWEPWETALVLDLLASDLPGMVVDLGCHVGWYTILAAVCGRDVLAVTADAEHLVALNRSARANDVAERIEAVRGWIDSDTPPLPPGQRVRLAKIDVEGAEGHAMRILRPMLDAGDIDFVLCELSPEFGGGWVAACGEAGLANYAGFEVPSKGDDLAWFERDPLAMTLCRPLHPRRITRQTTALFVRR